MKRKNNRRRSQGSRVMTNQPFVGNDSWSMAIPAGNTATWTANNIERDKDRVIYPLSVKVQFCAPGPCALVQVNIHDVDGAVVRTSGPVLVGYVPVTVTLNWPTNVRSKLVSSSSKEVVSCDHFCSAKDDTWKSCLVLTVGSLTFRSEREQFQPKPCSGGKLHLVPIAESEPASMRLANEQPSFSGGIGATTVREGQGVSPRDPLLGGESPAPNDRTPGRTGMGGLSRSWASLPHLWSVRPDERIFTTVGLTPDSRSPRSPESIDSISPR